MRSHDVVVVAGFSCPSSGKPFLLFSGMQSSICWPCLQLSSEVQLMDMADLTQCICWGLAKIRLQSCTRQPSCSKVSAQICPNRAAMRCYNLVSICPLPKLLLRCCFRHVSAGTLPTWRRLMMPHSVAEHDAPAMSRPAMSSVNAAAGPCHKVHHHPVA